MKVEILGRPGSEGDHPATESTFMRVLLFLATKAIVGLKSVYIPAATFNLNTLN